MSRWTRASTASSLLALSLAASGCASEDRSPTEVGQAFASARIRLGPALTRHGFTPAPVRPLDALVARARALAPGSVSAGSLPPPETAFTNGGVEVLVYDSAAPATRAEQAFGWAKGHTTQIERALPQAKTPPGDLFAHLRAERRGNVVVIFPARLERRGEAALDRLG